MAGDAQATRKRLLDAAAAEFAAYGIAGARVDRIAETARSNKAQIYHYYGSKDALFDAVFNALVVETVSEIPIDADDLPEYAGRLFDRYEARPDVVRLATWHRLERGQDQGLLDSVVTSTRDKVEAVARAQKTGTLPATYSAAELLVLVLHLSMLWATMTPEFGVVLGRHSRARRRALVTGAVAALVAQR
ncbi:MAG TPA: TetR family transcriptional regulator [Mycobacteriales bacterium]|nr:TetR family transcriptional regulator [Mycobacteriales bacterium]